MRMKEQTNAEVAYHFYHRIARIAANGGDKYMCHPRAWFNYHGWLNTYAELENKGHHEKWSDVRAAAGRSVKSTE